MALAQLTVVVSALIGWTDITIQPSKGDRGMTAFQRSLGGSDRASERTLDTLKRHDLQREYRKDPSHAIMRLERRARELAQGGRLDAEIVYALAELSLVEGRRLDRWRRTATIDPYIDAVSYAHDYLFDPALAEGRRPSDPRFRLACEIYKTALERILREVQSSKDGRIEPDATIHLKVNGQEQILNVVLNDSPWKASDVHKIILASDYEVTGLNTPVYRYGVGVPLIGVRITEPKKGDALSPQERFYPPEMAFPLTAFLVPNSRLRAADGAGQESRKCTLELIDPVRHRTVGSRDNVMAVESDLSKPLAYMWSRTDLDHFRWKGLLRPEQGMERTNLLLIRPYEPGKIPVVMVHGLISSPLAWIPLLNELLLDAKIQQKYQFMLFMYPTGVPIPIAAAALRDTLTQAKQLYDPNGTDPAFEQMVLLGHSMGGLLSHTMALNSGDQLWRLYSDRSFRDIIPPRDHPEDVEELKKYLFFEPLPFVKRVVFMATPHRGADLARGFVGRVSSNLISDPDRINDLIYRLVKDNSDYFDRRRFKRFPSSIETLEPNSPILTAILNMKPKPDVTLHSIIGSTRPVELELRTDGVVPYRSSHIDGVASEKVVRSDHGVQNNGEAIGEVIRILREHTNSQTSSLARQSRDSAIRPAQSTLPDLPPLPAR